jgi:LuxR family maltose regulon positive regulatory protein
MRECEPAATSQGSSPWGFSSIAPVTRSRSNVPHLPGIPAIRVQAKSSPPPVRDGSVLRRALLDRLAASPAVLVSVAAPPGYGKTTFMAQAAVRERRAVAWVSLDAHDDDPAILVQLLAAALHLVRPIEATVFEAIAAPAISPWSAVTRLSSALEDHPAVALFVDDVDALPPGPAADVLAVMPELLPAGSRLVMASRAGPPIALSRRRAAATLLELDQGDLSLDDAEAFEFARAIDHGIDRETTTALNRRAEGWSAGLYLGLLATAAEQRDSGAPNRSDGLAGDVHAIADYLRSEILAPLGPDRVAFLRRTSFLERLTGPLCDAVLGRTDSASILAEMAAANRFLLPLDDRGVWYRPHRLLRDLLRADLGRESPDDVAGLAINASTWFEGHDSPAEAIACARLADDEARLARLLVTYTQVGFNQGSIATVQRWFDECENARWMPRHPEVAVTGAIYFAMAGDARRSGQWMHQASATDFTGSMPDGSDSIEAWLALSRAITAQHGAAAMLTDAIAAVDQIPPRSQWRTAALATLGAAQYLAGQDVAADASLADADRATLPPAAATARALALAYRATVAIERGDWDEAAGFVAAARDSVLRSGLTELSLMSLVFALAARVAMRRGNRIQAASDQAHANRLRPGLSDAVPWLAVGANLELARVALAQADAAGARTLLREADDVLRRFPSFGRLVGDAATLRQQVSASASVVVGASALTAAELRLLPYLSTYLSFREIGERVGVSANTIKSQTMSIYRKLDVSSRGEAIARAAAIGLTDPLRDPGFRRDEPGEARDNALIPGR